MTEPSQAEKVFQQRFLRVVVIAYIVGAAAMAWETREVVVDRGLLFDTKELRSFFSFSKFFAFLIWPGLLALFGGRFLGGVVAGILYGGQEVRANSSHTKSVRSPPPPALPRTALEPFFQTYLHLAAQLCRADGAVSPSEIAFLDAAFAQEMGLDEGQVKEARISFRNGKWMDLNIESASQEVRHALGSDLNAVAPYANFLVRLAMADGALNGPESEFLRRVLRSFGYSAADVEELLRFPEGTGSGEASAWGNVPTLEPFLQMYLHLAAKLCRADGPVSPKEIAFIDAAFVQKMGLDELQVRDARNCFRDGKWMELNIETAARDVRWALGSDQNLVDIYAHILIDLGKADAPLSQPEKDFLRTVLSAFGYSSSKIDDLISPRQEANSSHEPSWKRALELLELQEGFSKEELRAAYKRKAKEFHPDTMMSLSPGLRKLAEEQLKDINLAYAKLKVSVS